MKAKLLLLGLTLIASLACNKNLYTAAPQLKFLSVNGSAFASGDLVSFKMQVTDKEGDIQDSLWIQKVALDSECVSSAFIDSLPMPDFPSSRDLKGEIDINYIYNQTNGAYPTLTGCTLRNDSCYFKFWLKDRASHVSDTATSPIIVLLNQ